MGIGQKFLTRVVVGSAIFGLGLENFPLKYHIFNFFLFGLGQKVPGSKAGWPLIFCGSKVCLSQVRSRPISNRQRSEFSTNKDFLKMVIRGILKYNLLKCIFSKKVLAITYPNLIKSEIGKISFGKISFGKISFVKTYCGWKENLW